ncbi:MAG: hypothetical protein KKH72_04635 [Alphaproteobacteria bacterium]|nr:hypothetical protein [Alphaproteobacteria bacterium]
MSVFFHTVAIVITHTPLWVWALYALLLFLGFQRTRDSSVALWRVLILPLVVTLLAILTLIGDWPSALPTMLVGLALGASAGWQIEGDGATRRLPDGRLWLRSEWWSLGQIVLILIFRYAINVVAAMNPVLNANTIWHFSSLLISAALWGVFVGRTAARLRVYFAAAPANAA